jgi:hypothetical protein
VNLETRKEAIFKSTRAMPISTSTVNGLAGKQQANNRKKGKTGQKL